MRLRLLRFVEVQLARVYLLGLLETFFEFFADWYDVSVDDLVCRELVQEFLLRHGVQAVQVHQCFKLRILLQLLE